LSLGGGGGPNKGIGGVPVVVGGANPAGGGVVAARGGAAQVEDAGVQPVVRRLLLQPLLGGLAGKTSQLQPLADR